jgi:hypothetical protein
VERLEESRVRRRKSSTTDAVLERNLTFIDTPGYGTSASVLDDQNLVVDYVESLLYQNASVASMEDNDLLGVISGSGGVQVDVVFYLLNPGRPFILPSSNAPALTLEQYTISPRMSSSCNASLLSRMLSR